MAAVVPDVELKQRIDSWVDLQKELAKKEAAEKIASAKADADRAEAEMSNA